MRRTVMLFLLYGLMFLAISFGIWLVLSVIVPWVLGLAS